MLFRILNTLFLSILFLSFGFTQDRTAYQVDGNVFFEDGDNHGWVQISFYDLLQDPPQLTDSTFSDDSGYFEIDLESGYYLVEWSYGGYVPWELGGFAHGSDVTLDDVTLVPGEVITVTGEQSGSWTTSYQYWVQDTVTVPEGETLTIDAGVRVKFLQGAGMVCYGTLEANGTEDEHVIFTSKQPTPLPGDWDNIELYGENNVISYVDYEYATDGFTGDGASGSTFDHLMMVGTLSLTANGIYLTNSSNMTFTNNQISVAGKGIYANNAEGSTISNNVVNTSGYSAFEMDYCHGCSFDNNVVTNQPQYGIMVRYSDIVSFTNNNLDVAYTGFSCHDGSYYTFDNNTVTNFDEDGIYFQCSENAIITNNHLETDSGGCWKAGIRNDCSTPANATINNNYVKVENNCTFDNHVYGILVHDSEIDSNEVEVYQHSNWRNEAYGIYAHRSTITNNIIYVYDCCDNHSKWGYGIMSWAESNNRSSIEGNTITAVDETRGIWASYADITNNTITGISNNEWSIGGGTENSIQNNTITNMREGLHLDGYTGWVVNNNIIQVHYDNGIYMNNSSGTFTYNLIISGGTGILCQNQSGEEFSHNTIIGNGGDFGIHISNLSQPVVNSNIIVGFQNGIYDENDLQNNQIRFNDLYNISNEAYSGTGLPVMIGSYVNEIATMSGDSVLGDIYGNMNANPQFAMPDEGNYELQLISPCINNGDPSILDPDGTGSDIGAFYKDAGIEEDVYGCMDETACNYNAGATLDNGDCTTATTWYWDEDGDGLGFIESTEVACDQPIGFVSNSDDSDPQCASNDTDECGICAGGNLDQDCNGDCFGEATTDDCDVCSGGLSEHEANSDQDCNGECFGGAFIDGCSICVGGSTGLEACPEDCNAVFGGDAFWDDCQVCSGGDTGHEANSDMDCAGVCYGDNIGDSFDGCCFEEAIDDCGECDGNGWDLCDADGDGTGNYEQWGYGIWGARVTDVDNDQGGWVDLSFNKSFYDTDSLRTVEIYTIQRWEEDHWTSLHSISAYADEVYYTIVMTAADSSSTTDGSTLFRVIANMDEGNFENNEEIWGYSVDNISPIVPNQMSASSTGNNVSLSWNYEMETDFQYHQVTSLFETAYTTENSYEFILNDGDNNEHWVNAFDTHDNVSEDSQSLMSKKLHAGANLISFNVLPDDNSIENVMASIEGNATGVIGEGVAANYMEGIGWMGSLDDITSCGAYWLIVNEEDILLTTGYPTDRTIPCELHAGANLIGYPYRYPTEIEDALPEDIGCDISGIICEGVAAICTESGWVGSLSSLEGTYGCWFIVEEAMDITFNGCDEQECASLSRQSQNLSTVPEGYEYKQSTTQAFYFIESIENIEIGNWILAYNGDEVIGARQWTGRFIDLPAMGSDGSDNTKGYIDVGLVPSFKILRGDELINLEGDIPSWENNQLYMVSSLTEVALPEAFSLSAAYPNPFNPVTTLSFAIPVDSEVFLSVYNLQGREVVSLINGNMDAGYHSVIWNADTYSSGVYFVKMVGGEYVSTQKLMLIK